MDNEKAERQRIVDEAVASLVLEGLIPSEEDMAYTREFVEGRMTASEMAEKAISEFRA